MTSPIVMPTMAEAQADAWHALMKVYEVMPSGWTLAGGQLVHLHCAERGIAPGRVTIDEDAVVDVRTVANGLLTFTSALAELGFAPEISGDGLQHRWVRDPAQIDVLIPRGTGDRTESRPGVGGAPTISTPGAQQALDRSETVTVLVNGVEGQVNRPRLLGALILKAAAHTVGANVGRHRLDFVTLARAMSREDIRGETITTSDRRRLTRMVEVCEADPLAMEAPDAMRALSALRVGLGT